ncbi:patatin-like phospholipase family protein [Lachnospiraceae bacterium MD1]|jgi:NTE family protein|uniref:Patatin-like phospholipase family protein n=1 Tax=Variimorphobacter saccharofermentans TaxID=2755051 RepID=A0A839JWK6_9FIRM|nr:patatin-like phospholipase family protein [Variimorphobacter saccharofermentans]MBB2181628.1 patatin-like phospholipase family protein [Variimorphobacter saccharofermentans]
MIRERFDFEKEYGLVLEGGGAKGAYQIGVWKAFLECGVKIKGIAGVSVGALNGALICMGDYEKAVDIWKNISYSRIINVDDNQMEKLMNLRFKELSLQEVRKQGKSFLTSGGLDVTPLRQLMDETVDEQKIRESNIEFIMGTFNLNNMKEIEIDAKEAEDGSLKDYLLASASFPLFKNEKLNGVKYLDGGIANNVPIDMLINRGYTDIIVVRIFGIGIEKKVKIPEEVRVTYIAPKTNLCNVLEFNRKKAIRNITLGYYDALRILKALAGNDYYIESNRIESEYLASLANMDEEQMKDLFMQHKHEGNVYAVSLRKLTQELYPRVANMLKLAKNWDYSDLYYGILEYCAKKLRISRYRVYTESEFCKLLMDKMENTELTVNEVSKKPDLIMSLGKAIVKNIVIT